MNYLIMKMLVIYRDKKLFKMKKSYILISYCLIIVFIRGMPETVKPMNILKTMTSL